MVQSGELNIVKKLQVNQIKSTIMAVQLDPNLKDDLKTQFITREGVYRLMTLSEYSRPNRVGYTNTQSSPQVRVSIVTLPTSSTGGGSGLQQNTNSPVINGNGGGGDFSTTESTASRYQHNFGAGPSLSIDSRLGGGSNGCGGGDGSILGGDRICFNFGKELYVYAFRGVKKVSILRRLISYIILSQNLLNRLLANTVVC